MMDNVETKLKNLILKNIEFKIDDKTIRRGKLKLFNTKQFFIKLKLSQNESDRQYEIPYPYAILNVDNGYIFDYTLSAMAPPTEEIYYKMKLLNKENASKLHDNYLFIVEETVDSSGG